MRLLPEMANAIDLLIPFAERNPFPFGSPIYRVWDAAAKQVRAEAEAMNTPSVVKNEEPTHE